MKKVFFLAGSFMMMVLVSCKKDKIASPGTGTPSKLLTRLTKTEDNKTTVFNLLYNESKRLSSYKSTDNLVGIVFTYDATGNLTKVEDMEDDFKNIYIYAYNNNASVAGTLKSWHRTAGEPDELIEDDQLTYTLANNQVSKIHILFTQTGDAADFTLSYSNNGNLSKVVSAGIEGYTANFSYGTKKPVFPMVSKYILDQAGFSLQFTAKNELLWVAYDFPGTQFDKTITTQYTYDANGYILSSSDGTSQISFKYQ